MNKLVYTVFKTIMISMILIFVFDMVSYLYRAMSLNQRMESIMVSMQRCVMENNGLNESAYNMYKGIFSQLACDMNGDTNGNGVRDAGEQWFINGYWINYGTPARNCLTTIQSKRQNSSGTLQAVNILHSDMKNVASYGDVMTVQVGVQLNQPSWGFVDNSYSGNDWQNSVTSNKIAQKTTEFWYTYYVPCLRYMND